MVNTTSCAIKILRAENAFGYFLVDIYIYIYNQKSTQHTDICNKYMYICTHIEIYIGTGLEYSQPAYILIRILSHS